MNRMARTNAEEMLEGGAPSPQQAKTRDSSQNVRPI
jgi:hypothetical protein